MNNENGAGGNHPTRWVLNIKQSMFPFVDTSCIGMSRVLTLFQPSEKATQRNIDVIDCIDYILYKNPYLTGISQRYFLPRNISPQVGFLRPNPKAAPNFSRRYTGRKLPRKLCQGNHKYQRMGQWENQRQNSAAFWRIIGLAEKVWKLIILANFRFL